MGGREIPWDHNTDDQILGGLDDEPTYRLMREDRIYDLQRENVELKYRLEKALSTLNIVANGLAATAEAVQHHRLTS